MSLALVYTRAALGLNAPLVTVEVHLSNGLPALAIVGLPEAAVRESKDRVRSALINAGFEFPQRRLTINLAPADLPKEGGRFDLPIALGILAASGQISVESLQQREFLGELALTGELRPILGVLSASLAATKEAHQLFVPEENAAEAARPKDAHIYGVKDLATIEISMNDLLRFNPDSLSVQQGETIRLRITNNGKIPHEFVLGTRGCRFVCLFLRTLV